MAQSQTIVAVVVVVAVFVAAVVVMWDKNFETFVVAVDVAVGY